MSRIHEVDSQQIKPLVLELQALLEADAMLVIALTDLGQMRTQISGEESGFAYRALKNLHDALLQGGMVTQQVETYYDGPESEPQG